MIIRTVVTASSAALALVALSIPVGNAQTGESGPADDGGGSSILGSAETGSLGSLSGGETSADDLVSAGDEVCQLPSLGGSVAKFYPLAGIDGVPAGVIDMVTSALDSFPNLFDVIAGEAGAAALLAETGSLDEGLCTSIFGGEMVLPPVTVIVDDEGVPVTTVTGTVNTNDSGSAAGSSSSGSGSAALPTSVPTPSD